MRLDNKRLSHSRAMRLARSRGIEVVPIKADYRGVSHRFSFRDYIPSAAAREIPT